MLYSPYVVYNETTSLFPQYHQKVKQDAVDGNHCEQSGEKFYYYPNVPLLFFRN